LDPTPLTPPGTPELPKLIGGTFGQRRDAFIEAFKGRTWPPDTRASLSILADRIKCEHPRSLNAWLPLLHILTVRANGGLGVRAGLGVWGPKNLLL